MYPSFVSNYNDTLSVCLPSIRKVERAEVKWIAVADLALCSGNCPPPNLTSYQTDQGERTCTSGEAHKDKEPQGKDAESKEKAGG